MTNNRIRRLTFGFASVTTIFGSFMLAHLSEVLNANGGPRNGVFDLALIGLIVVAWVAFARVVKHTK